MTDLVQPGLVQRAEEVREKLFSLNSQMEDGFLDICDLLLEAQEQAYHTVYGYGRFADWVDNAGLDLKWRTAFYLVKIAKTARQLNLSRESLKKAKISKLKKICTLNPEQYGEKIRQLVDAAPELTLDEVSFAVAELKAADGVVPSVYMTLKFGQDIKALVDEAFELARRNYGGQIIDGEEVDIPDSKCLEIICQDYLLDPNNNPEY